MRTTLEPSTGPGPAPRTTRPGDVAAVRAVDLVKTYGSGRTAVRALDSVSVAITRGQLTAVMGPSGSGKSTLMHCLAGLDTVTSGQVFLGGREISGLADRELTTVRRDQVGFVFQAFNLLPTLTAAQNITLPLELAGTEVDPGLLQATAIALGLQDRLAHRPSELSGGQQQRVAIARALITRPDVVFADEPTGALDSRTGQQLLAQLRSASRELGQTIVLVTHDPAAAAHADRVLLLADGALVDELDAPGTDDLLAALTRLGS
ncbi:putative ABC transport system ATP-binding protein [Friedmanniella luteola]|uniref:Putative ABC transport system ATP-binding protein n=1 Tax=Friedmanniella luteola TaxID=546871 RepID=A0A1H2A8V3_9ACTN|nr:putative ABC transport system ATP-binding protein [Friedmanniella luteola]